MVEIHGENPNVDYMLKFDKIIGDNPTIPSESDKISLELEVDKVQVIEHNDGTLSAKAIINPTRIASEIIIELGKITP